MTDSLPPSRALALPALALALCLPFAAHGQAPGATVTVTVEGVRSDGGRVTGSLCSEAPTVFCSTYVARTPSVAGRTTLRFTGVAPGRYALSTVHDEDGDGRTEIPPEGFALGNNAMAPNFDTSSIQIGADTALAVTMTYPGTVRMGSKGIAPPEGVVRIDVRERGLYGELYAPRGAGRRLPAVIVIDGSVPGLDGASVVAADFARAGFAALALAYFGEEGLPLTLEGIPLEYFDAALAVLTARPEVDANRIGVLGVSRGSEAAFLLATRNPGIRAVGAVGPSGVAWGGYDPADPANSDAAWTLAGRPLPHLSPDLTLYDPNGSMTPMYVSVLAKTDDRHGAMIPVERIKGPILLISGEKDQIWPSPEMAKRIEARLSRAGFTHGVENVVMPGVSHYVLSNGDTAMTRFVAFFRKALGAGGSD